jgi:hypothetical protein
MATYPYIPLPAKPIHRPYLRIWLSNQNNQKRTPQIRGLLDTGSDICLASKEIGIWLGIHFVGDEETVSIQTANGSISYAVKKTVTLITEESQHKCPFFFVEGITPDQPPLLGQQGFFDHFKVCFDLNNKVFEIF